MGINEERRYRYDATLSYDAAGREITRAFANGVNRSNRYRADNLLENRSARGPEGKVQDLSYSYDANKRVTRELNQPHRAATQTFAYDNADRLTQWQRPDPAGLPWLPINQGWNLSPVGDWNSSTTDRATQTRSHNAVHELTAIGSTALAYDAKGNLSQDHQGQQYTWDPENRLHTAVVSANTTHYRYDALGRRISKTTNVPGGSSETLFLSAGAQEIEEIHIADGVPSQHRAYIFGAYVDDLIAQIENPVQADQQISYAHSNRVYSIHALTSASGAITRRYAYGPYGQRAVLDASGNTATPDGQDAYGFTGRRFDAETGLWYFRARYYSAEMGRFLARDPLGYVDGMGLYAGYFVPGGVDPWGLWDEAGHFYTTALILKMAGVTNYEEIAYWSQYPDEVSDYDAIDQAAGNYFGSKWGCRRPGIAPHAQWGRSWREPGRNGLYA